MTFKAYMDNIQAATGKTPDEFWKMANKKGFIKRGKMVATYSQLLKWLKSDIKLGHVRANFMILYLRLRANDKTVPANSKKWALSTGYKEYA
jgi:hypothetical protein